MAGTHCPHPLRDRLRAARGPHVDLTLDVTGGTVRLLSASGGLESVWISLHDEGGRKVAWDAASGTYHAAPVRLTPHEARDLAAILTAYADSHPSVGEDDL